MARRRSHNNWVTNVTSGRVTITHPDGMEENARKKYKPKPKTSKKNRPTSEREIPDVLMGVLSDRTEKNRNQQPKNTIIDTYGGKKKIPRIPFPPKSRDEEASSNFAKNVTQAAISRNRQDSGR